MLHRSGEAEGVRKVRRMRADASQSHSFPQEDLEERIVLWNCWRNVRKRAWSSEEHERRKSRQEPLRATGACKQAFPIKMITKITLGETYPIHQDLARKFVPMPQAMNILDAEVSVDKEWKEVEKLPGWQLSKMVNEKEVILEAQRDKSKVHLVSLMDICHLKNTELEPKYQKYKKQSCVPR